MVVGASVRALAGSCLKAGLLPYACDLFADRDLKAACSVTPVDGSAASYRAAVEAAPPGPLIYTGGLENCPELIEAFAARRTVWGVTGTALRQVRDPFLLQEVLREAGLPSLAVQTADDAVPPADDRSWLLKPRASAGGLRIRVADGTTSVSDPAAWYRQEFVAGKSFSAAFVASAKGTSLLGITRQWIGRRQVNAGPFHYCGSIGPVRWSDRNRDGIRRIGECVSAAFGLRGLFGVDVIANRRGVWVTEVNPRYTASMEVLDPFAPIPLLAQHGVAFGQNVEAPSGGSSAVAGVLGKLVVYAPRELAAPDFPAAWWHHSLSRWTPLADVPGQNSLVPAGGPICTVRAEGKSVRDCGRVLHRWSRRVLSRVERWNLRNASGIS